MKLKHKAPKGSGLLIYKKRKLWVPCKLCDYSGLWLLLSGLWLLYSGLWGFPCGSDSKESAWNAGDPGLIPCGEDSLEKGMTTHSSILAWRIPWTEEDVGGLQSMGLQRIRHDRGTNNFTFTLVAIMNGYVSIYVSEDYLHWYKSTKIFNIFLHSRNTYYLYIKLSKTDVRLIYTYVSLQPKFLYWQLLLNWMSNRLPVRMKVQSEVNLR